MTKKIKIFVIMFVVALVTVGAQAQSVEFEQVAVETTVREKVKASHGKPRDIVSVTSSKTPGRQIVLKSMDKYGWCISPVVGFEFSSEMKSPIGGLRVSYDARWLGGFVEASFGQQKYNSNAIRTGMKYWSYRTSFGAIITPFKLDYRDEHRLGLVLGARFSYFETDSKPDENGGQFSSTGNELAPELGLRYEWRNADGPFSLFVEGLWTQNESPYQNLGREKFSSFIAKVGFSIKLKRHVYKTK